jgi:hypothetical protein
MEIDIVSSFPIWNGTGKVTGAATNHPIGSFDCSVSATTATGTCSVKWEDYLPPTFITLTATPTGNSVFRGWGPGCTGAGSGGNVCVIPVRNDAIQIRAAFEIPAFALYVLPAGSGSGKVVSAPVGIDCTIASGVPNQFCGGIFSKGSEVTLTADPTGGSTFGGWTDGCTGTQLTCVIGLDAEKRVTVRFVAPRPAAELAMTLLGGATLPVAEANELDRFGNKDGAFNLGDLLALLTRTGERLSAPTMSALLRAQRHTTVQHGSGRNP